MTDRALEASVVICAYTEERWDDLIAAIESVRIQTTPPREIVVVIDHNPHLLSRVKATQLDIVVVENKEVRGLSGARNSGIAVATGELVAFLDDDAVAAPDWLERLSGYCNRPDVLGAGGFVEPMWQDGQPAWFPEEFYWVIGCSYRGLPEATAPVRNPFGGCSCIRREVFAAIGGYESSIGRAGGLPMGCEETELSIRANQRWPDRVFLYEPAAKINHRIPAERTQWSYFRARCYAEGRSKALVARLVGPGAALAAERTYTLRTLPRGVLRGLADTLLHRDFMGVARSGAIIAGLLLTTAGYVQVAVLDRIGPRRAAGNEQAAIRPHNPHAPHT